MIIEQKASTQWKDAFKLSNEGKFEEQSKLCNSASKLYLRASNLSADIRKAKLFYSYSFMLKASMHEAIANEFIKNKNDAKGSARPYELASEAMQQAIESYPHKDDDKATVLRWEAQKHFYKGNSLQSKGIHNLDSENYSEALGFFNEAEKIFGSALSAGEKAEDEALIKLIQKSIAEAQGYIGMCKTVME